MSKNKEIVAEDTILSVPFYDVDLMGICWHGHYVKYFEDARCRLLEKIGYDYRAMSDSGFAWPVIDVRIKYIKPLTFNQKIKVHAWIEEYEMRLLIRYLITDVDTNEKITKGYTSQVAVNMDTEEMMFESPAILREKLQAYL